MAKRIAKKTAVKSTPTPAATLGSPASAAKAVKPATNSFAAAKPAVSPAPAATAPAGTRVSPMGGSALPSTNAPAGRVAKRNISKDMIAKRAYEIWVAKGRPQGQELQNWQQAERELGMVA